MKEYLIDLTKYNIWANRRLVGLCKKYIDLIELPVKSSFPTIRATLEHNLFAEAIWLSRLEGNTSPNVVKGFKGKNEDLFEAIIRESIYWRQFIGNHKKKFLKKDCNYQDTKGDTFQQNNGKLTLHVMNHSSYHRGQITTLLRELGATELVSMDYITYLREQAISSEG